MKALNSFRSKMSKNLGLLEASQKLGMSKDERIAKRYLINLLLANNHPRYAERLEHFDINFDTRTIAEGGLVAAICYDNLTVYVNKGFFFPWDPNIAKELDPLLRHELSHTLLKHFSRSRTEFLKIISDDPKLALSSDIDQRITNSQSIHELFNILEDFEISNKVYSEEDKNIIRTMKLGAESIAGLVTEDHAPSWKKLTLEEMIQQSATELDKLWKNAVKVLNTGASLDLNDYGLASLAKVPSSIETIGAKRTSAISQAFTHLAAPYFDTNHKASKATSNITVPLSDFIEGHGVFVTGRSALKFAELNPFYQNVLTELNTVLTKTDQSNKTEQALTGLIKDISTSSPIEGLAIVAMDANDTEITDSSENPISVELWTPEEKAIAIQGILAFMGRVLKPKNSDNAKKKPKLKVTKKVNSKLYRDLWNKIVELIKSGKISKENLPLILAELANRSEIDPETSIIKPADETVDLDNLNINLD